MSEFVTPKCPGLIQLSFFNYTPDNSNTFLSQCTFEIHSSHMDLQITSFQRKLNNLIIIFGKSLASIQSWATIREGVSFGTCFLDQ